MMTLTSPQLSSISEWLYKNIVSRVRADIKANYFPAADDKKAGYYPVRDDLTIDDIGKHLSGRQPIGAYLMHPQTDGFVKAAVVDFDDKTKVLSWEDLCCEAREVHISLEEKGFIPFAVRSGSGHGIHLWLLWNDLQPAAEVRAVLKQIVTDCQLRCHVDIFPAQSTLEGRLGNLVALPFGRESLPMDIMTDNVVALNDWQMIDPAVSRPVHVPPQPSRNGFNPGIASTGSIGVIADWTNADQLSGDAGRGMALMAEADAYGPVDPAFLAEAISHVSAAEYQTWMKYGLALKGAAGSGQLSDADAFKIWDDWSKTSTDKYDVRGQDKEWRGFRPREQGAVTLGTLWHEAKESGWKPKPQLVSQPSFSDLVPESAIDESEKLIKKEMIKSPIAVNPKHLSMAGSMVPKMRQADSVDNLIKNEMVWLTGKGGNEVDLVNEKHFIAQDGGKVRLFREDIDEDLNRHVLVRMSVQDFKVYYQNQQVVVNTTRTGKLITKALGDLWLDSPYRRQYREIVLRPEGAKPWQYNLWKGWTVEPSEEGSWALLRQHIFENICREDEIAFDYVIKWCALTIQRPETPIGTALVLRGNRGNGKSSFIRAIGELFGQHFMHVMNSRSITGTFNSHLRDCIMLFADEAVWAGSRSEESTLKGLVTEPTLTIEGKGRDAVTARNMLHLVIATNHDWAVPAGIDERRFCCLNVGDKHQQDKAYFRAIQKQLLEGGSARLLYDMLNMDVSDFDPQNVPRTDELMEQKIASLDTVGKWWHYRLMEGSVIATESDWEEKVAAISVYQDYMTFCVESGIRTYLGGPAHLTKSLGRFLGIGIRSVPAERHWAMVNGQKTKATLWYFPNLEACRVLFAEALRSDIRWPKDATGSGKVVDPRADDNTLDF